MSVRASLFASGAALLILAGAASAEPRDPLKRPAQVRQKIAQAPAVKVTCDVIEISASTGKDASIDPAIKKLEKKLAAQPWSFNQYKLLSQSSKTLEKGKQESLGLKEGSGTAKLVETVDKSKVRLTITEDHGGKRLIDNTTTIAAGDWLIQGHPLTPNKDGHLVAISCK
jgi:Flp pilus assembly secretin CpaC